jgi:transposase
MDVHRDFVVACIAATNRQGVTEYTIKRFSTYSGGLRDLAAWLTEHRCTDVCMESTGKYWFPVHNILEKTCHVVVTHPKFVKAIKGKKTDKKDAQWIADLFKHDLVRGSFIPPEPIRQLRDLCRYWQKLTWYTTGEKNRAQNCLTVSNFKLDSVFSNVFGKSASAVISYMLEHPGEQFDVTPLIHRGCKSSIKEIQAAIDGLFSPWQAEKLKVIRLHMDDLALLKASVESLVFKLAEPYIHQIHLLLTVPGISEPMTAIRIIAEIGADMSQFESSKHLCSWAGLTPQNNESAGKKKTTRIGKAGQYIKPLLIQCALAASNPRSNLYPEILCKYQQLKKRRGYKKARVAIARRLLTAIFHILLKDEPYKPFVAPSNDSIPLNRVLTKEQALAMIRRKGFIIVQFQEIGKSQ